MKFTLTHADLTSAIKRCCKSGAFQCANCITAVALSRTLKRPVAVAFPTVMNGSSPYLPIGQLSAEAGRIETAFDNGRFAKLRRMLPITLEYTPDK